MKLFGISLRKCMISDDQAHTIDNVYSAKISADNVLEDKLEAAKNYLGEKYILHPKHNVKRKGGA